MNEVLTILSLFLNYFHPKHIKIYHLGRKTTTCAKCIVKIAKSVYGMNYKTVLQ